MPEPPHCEQVPLDDGSDAPFPAGAERAAGAAATRRVAHPAVSVFRRVLTRRSLEVSGGLGSESEATERVAGEREKVLLSFPRLRCLALEHDKVALLCRARSAIWTQLFLRSLDAHNHR